MIGQRRPGFRIAEPAVNGQRGQTMVVALLVMLLLAFVGALFVTIVARNLFNARKSIRITTADYYAQAGIQYADSQLTRGADGADWRPIPPGPAAKIPDNDPDAKYLKANFTRFNQGAGRFLLRVTYNPLGAPTSQTSVGAPNNDALGKYIKIESIGREGNVDSTDPTTFNVREKTQSMLVAYKAIGITDYARFVTNISHRSDPMNIGVPSVYHKGTGIADPDSFYTQGVYDLDGNGAGPVLLPIVTQYGAFDAYTIDPTTKRPVPNPDAGKQTVFNPNNYEPGGGAVRVNGTARFYGLNYMYLNVADSTKPTFEESTHIAGDFLLDSFDPTLYDATKQDGAESSGLQINPNIPGLQTPFLYPSSVPAQFTTANGALRDGSPGSDAQGFPRGVKTLDPPVIDSVDSGTGLSRYADITLNSSQLQLVNVVNNGTVAQASITDTNAALDGWGRYTYINNDYDLQPESSAISGGYTLVDDWLNRTTSGSTGGTNSSWLGDFYEPPGVKIIFGPLYDHHHSDGRVRYGVTMILDQGHTWKDVAGNLPTGTTVAPNVREIEFEDFLAFAQSNSAGTNDIIIYATGNVRVFGILSDPNASNAVPVNVTVVSNGTAYIDGSLLKGDPRSSIAVMAKDYVCVNTTQFTAGPNNALAKGVTLPGYSPHGVTLTDKDVVAETLNFAGPASVDQSLYFSAAPQASQPALIRLSIFNNAIGAFGDGGSVPRLDAPGIVRFQVPEGGIRTSFNLATASVVPPAAAAFPTLDQTSSVDLYMDNTNTDVPPGTTGTVDVERLAILPNDVRIEAMLYAQNRSFFVIPGEWFNPVSGDDLSAYVQSVKASKLPGGKPASRSSSVDDTVLEGARFPFYAQPIDLKVTIYGAVSEAQPADISAQAAWMRKWGWIPHFHGSAFPGRPAGVNSEPAGHTSTNAALPAAGLTLIYDPLWAYPGTTNNQTVTYLRTNKYGDPLPLTPKLPVSTGLLYSGQPAQLPLL